MVRSFHAALEERPLMFEPVPPSLRAHPMKSGLQTEELLRLLRGIGRLDVIDVPELVDENHDGRPYYRTGDTRAFAQTVAESAGHEVVVNKVVAHLASAAALEAWARETIAQGLRHVVLVGGSSRYIPYPGPPVLEANRICGPILAEKGGLLGNIAIPQRTGEANRMFAKTRAGTSFFTTQILFDADGATKLLRAYDRQCREASVRPGAVLLSFAPLADETDAEFVRWLGADVPEAAEQAILAGEDGTAAARSVQWAVEVYGEVAGRAREEHWQVPVGVNVEQISLRHLPSAVEMLRRFAERIDA